MTKQYRLHSYNVGPRVEDPDGDGAHAHIDAMTADGWTVHTANITWPEATVLWEREAVEEDKNEVDVTDAEGKTTREVKSHTHTTRSAAGATQARGRRSGAPSG